VRLAILTLPKMTALSSLVVFTAELSLFLVITNQSKTNTFYLSLPQKKFVSGYQR
jgi:hypothetical protein